MEIKKISAYATQAAQRPQEQGVRPADDEKSAGKDASVDTADRVRFSTGYQEMAQVKKVMMERGEIRTERVDQLRTQIENRTYGVDADKIAAKILDEIM